MKIWRITKKKNDVVDEATLARVVILRCFYWCGRWKSWLCRESITDRENSECQGNGGTVERSRWLKCGEPETWICKEIDATQRCVGKRGAGILKVQWERFSWDWCVVCHQLLLAVERREREQRQPSGDNWVIRERQEQCPLAAAFETEHGGWTHGIEHQSAMCL